MNTRSGKRSLHRIDEMPPFPEGWYFVANREDLLRRKLIEKVWMGEEIVAWCDDEGRVCVAGAFCPHLGSHMGPPRSAASCATAVWSAPSTDSSSYTTGRCVATPNAPAPKAAKLKVFETREILGMVFGWRGSNGRPPQGTCRMNRPPAGSGAGRGRPPCGSGVTRRRRRKTPWMWNTWPTRTDTAM